MVALNVLIQFDQNTYLLTQPIILVTFLELIHVHICKNNYLRLFR